MSLAFAEHPDRQPFQPLGERSIRDMIHDGIDQLPPLEPGTMLTYDMISEWIGEPFPRPTGIGERDYFPMPQIKEDLLERRGVLILNVETVGYKVATDAEKVAYAEREDYAKAIYRLEHAGRVIRSVDRSKVSASQRSLAEFMERETLEMARVLRFDLRACHRDAKKWSD